MKYEKVIVTYTQSPDKRTYEIQVKKTRRGKTTVKYYYTKEEPV